MAMAAYLCGDCHGYAPPGQPHACAAKAAPTTCVDCSERATIFLENIWKQRTPLCFGCWTRRTTGRSR